MRHKKLTTNNASSFSLVTFNVDMQIEHEFKNRLY